MHYIRPLVQTGPERPAGAFDIAGAGCWFDTVEVLSRNAEPRLIPASELPAESLTRLVTPRGAVAGMDLSAPRIMGILNVTPDSFSDGGQHEGAAAALSAAAGMVDAGADIIDIGGESTRPGAAEVGVETEIARTAPVISALRAQSSIPISIDTRKAPVARAAVAAGATLVNDVSGLLFDAALAEYCVQDQVPVCVMHSQGTPDVMQKNPLYDNILLDVYDALHARVEALVAAGLPRDLILIDPGIGFGKTLEHNLALLRGISLFHGLGCGILLGVSRKGFIGQIGQATDPLDRAPGSIAVGLAAIAQGVQILRVHDVAETAQALRLWTALHNAR
ncbi:dihydropteroate synthase [Thalassococcus sp. S3]|uniref:dihydropteroate synthase n=1 Tax=Thalassococcus sp. S3 TaxID=2017482 RepID=UPI0010242FD1|nr:dihydropteroate synthase [Thalassococcus sp. S3]QBF32372.1 dihydropteroate synthase [Thalassococcus sp. S3]